MDQSLTRRQAFMVLNGLPGMGPITLNRLLEIFGNDPVAVLDAPTARLQEAKRVGTKVAEAIRGWRTHFPLEREEARLASAGASFVTCQDDDYPVALRQMYIPRTAPRLPRSCASDSVNSRVSGDSRLSSRNTFAVGKEPETIE